MDMLSTTVLCGKCLKEVPCQCLRKIEPQPENIAAAIRMYGLMRKVA